MATGAGSVDRASIVFALYFLVPRWQAPIVVVMADGPRSDATQSGTKEPPALICGRLHRTKQALRPIPGLLRGIFVAGLEHAAAAH
jgi:hypothetical protein